jgi:hypothetical protein
LQGEKYLVIDVNDEASTDFEVLKPNTELPTINLERAALPVNLSLGLTILLTSQELRDFCAALN